MPGEDHVRDGGNAGARSGPGPPIGAVFEALADRQRRCLLRYMFDETDGESTLSDLVDHVLETVDTAVNRERVEVSFVHSHLPKLEDAGLVEFDEAERVVRYRGDPRLEAVFDVLDDHGGT